MISSPIILLRERLHRGTSNGQHNPSVQTSRVRVHHDGRRRRRIQLWRSSRSGFFVHDDGPSCINHRIRRILPRPETGRECPGKRNDDTHHRVGLWRACRRRVRCYRGRWIRRIRGQERADECAGVRDEYARCGVVWRGDEQCGAGRWRRVQLWCGHEAGGQAGGELVWGIWSGRDACRVGNVSTPFVASLPYLIILTYRTAPASGTSLFGAKPAATTGAGLFGQPAAPASAAPAPAPSSGGLFGQPAPASTTPPTGLFGQPAPAASAPAPAAGGLFGQPAANASATPAPAQAPAPGGLFGQPKPAEAAAEKPATTGSLFGGGAAGYVSGMVNSPSKMADDWV